MKIIPVLSWLLAGFFIFARLSFAAESDVDRLLDLLVEKNALTKDDAAAFRADLAVKKQAEKETQKEFSVISGKPIRISGYTQFRYRQDKSINDTGDIRRARLDIKGDVTERFKYRLQADFAGSSAKVLDAAISYKAASYLELTAGQFKIPFSQENLTSSPKLETINRSQVVEALAARGSDVIGNHNGRDIGVQASGNLLPAGDGYLLDYALGIFNGAGINSADTNEQKDFISRLVIHPFKGWSLGWSYYAGRYTLSSAPARVDDRDRVGGEFAYVNERVSLKGEYIKGNDGATNKDGWYAQAGYFFVPKKFQGVFKFDTFDPNTKTKDNETDVFTLGGNWYFNKWAFLQVNYELKDEQGKEVDNNTLIGQLTLQF